MQFDELFDYPAFWEQIWFNSKRKDRDLPEPVKLHQPHLIPGTVALADITEQTRVYHYTGTSGDPGWKGLAWVHFQKAVKAIDFLWYLKIQYT